MTAEPFSVAAALDAFVAESPREFDGRWHPSSLFGCARRTIYEMRGVPKTDPRTPKNLRTLFIGKHFHKVIQEAVAKAPGVVAYYPEVPVCDENLNIVGNADALRFMEDGTVELDEYKSKGEWAMKAALKEGGEGLPSADHLGQANTYANLLRRFGSPEVGIEPLGDRLQTIRFVYVAKESLEIHEEVVPVGDYFEIMSRVADLNGHMEKETLPPRLPKKNGKFHYMCRWSSGQCEWFSKCWEQDNA